MNSANILPRRAIVAAVVMMLCCGNVFALELDLQSTWCGVTGPTRMDCDTDNHLLYVTSPLGHEITVFDAGGVVVSTIETAGPPGAIELAPDGNLVVSIGRTVQKISLDGTVLLTYGLVNNYFIDPHDIVCAPDGRVYVSDDDDMIKVFDGTGSPLFTFGGYGYFNGHFDEPVSMAYNFLTEEIIVTDQNNYRMQAFDLNGDSLRHWGSEGSGLVVNGATLRSFGLDVDGWGHIWSLDILVDLVQVYDSAGAFLYSASLGTPDMRGGIDLAVDGNVLFVSSPSTNCVYVYGISTGTAPLNPPLDLTIMWSEGGAKLNWKRQAGATGYRVQRCSDLEFAAAAIEELGVAPDTTFTDVWSSNPHEICFYRVIAQTTLTGRMDAVGMDLPRIGDGRYRDPLDTEHESPHHVTHGVNCNSCHLRLFDYPNPMPEWWFGDHLCKSCHVETGFAKGVQTHLGPDTVACRVCHSPHYHQPQFRRYFIRNENPVGESNPMLFNHATDFIHGAPNFDGICEICHTQTSHYRNDGSDGGTHQAGTNCLICHKHENGFMPAGGGACNACHGAPPETGAHRAHYGGNVDQASYGTVQNMSNDSTYIISCGTCHPSSSSSFHQNGQVDIELYDAGAPSGSLKALNPVTAQYEETSGSCSNVYCHSATTWSSGPVGSPVVDVNEFPILDARGNLTYPPYQLNIGREYATVNWNGGNLDCNGCHRNGPQTAFPDVEAGVGNSHGWIDDWGYEDLHAWNMASDPLTCRVCHYGTVTAEQTWSRNAWDITTYDDVALNSKVFHVNGHKDVAFDPDHTVQVQDSTISLATAMYDPSTRTCSDVACHLNQDSPEWGKPYRWWEQAECDQCHNYTGWFGPNVLTGDRHESIGDQSCTRCHDPHPHR